MSLWHSGARFDGQCLVLCGTACRRPLRTFGSFAILGTLKAARTEALGADVAKARRGSGVPASLDDKAELDREVTDRKPALLEAMAMTTSSSRRGCGSWGRAKKRAGQADD